jgi:23S rRNA pseudouridine1911/1915/1917 synthase
LFSICVYSVILSLVEKISLNVNNRSSSQILVTGKDFLLAYKPPKTHTASFAGGGEGLVEWCAAVHPEIMDINGRRQGEGGLLHRLDYETSGLVLFARSQAALDNLSAQQEEGAIVKGYQALSLMAPHGLAGFPPPPESPQTTPPPVIESFFRPYGPGRKETRPVLELPKSRRRQKEIASDHGSLYRTEITNASPPAPGRPQWHFTLRIHRGFRHQIRCHLAWSGFPIVNDPVYSGTKTKDANPEKNILMLCAESLWFKDPSTDESLSYEMHQSQNANPQ